MSERGGSAYQLRRRKGAAEEAGEGDSHGTWAVSYGDMITLLLTFFILFMNLQRKDADVIEIQKSLVAELKRDTSEKAPPATSEPGKPEQLQVGNLKNQGIDEGVVNEWGGEVAKFSNRIVINFPRVSFFGLGQVALSASGEKALQEFAKKYAPYAGRNKLVVSAYTDQLKVKARPGRPFTDNLELSSLRAVRAMRILQRAGIPLSEMRLGGYGELRGVRLPASEKVAAERKGIVGDPLSRKIILMIEPRSKEDVI